MDSKRILVIIGGGIAAFRALDVMRELRRRGASVTPVMTAGAAEFVTPLSVSALAAAKVYRDLFDLTDEAEMGHIELSRSADLILVCPATASLMARMAAGMADDLATTLLLATDAPVMLAPAMNVRMWEHPATRRNVDRLEADGIALIGPAEGAMACGEFGPGRLSDVADIVDAVARHFADGPLAGRHAIVTSGPTHEPIDPVRYIANRSSGAQGAAIAAALRDAGARVTFVTGPAAVPPPPGVAAVRVETAAEMHAAAEAALPADILVAAAAVADWRVEGGEREQAQEDGRRPAGPVPRREPRHPPRAVPASAAPRPGRRLRRRDRRRDRPCRRQAPAQGVRLDRRERRLARNRHHGRAGERRDDHRRGRRRGVAAHGQGRGRRAPRGAHRGSSRMTPNVRIMRLPEGDASIALPVHATAGAAGADIRANLAVPDRRHGIGLAPGARALVPAGFAMAVPEGWEAQIRPRSGLALRHGITVLNAPGTIDADYRGPVVILLVNLGDEAFRIDHGRRIAQLLLAPAPRPGFEVVEALEGTDRGSGGFGSTGVE